MAHWALMYFTVVLRATDDWAGNGTMLTYDEVPYPREDRYRVELFWRIAGILDRPWSDGSCGFEG